MKVPAFLKRPWLPLIGLTAVTATALFYSCSPELAGENEDHEVLAVGQQGISCGVERWSVKTGTDADISRFTYTVTPTTISTLRGYTAPSTLPSNNRISPQELTTYKLTNVTLTEYKLETDSDYHLVLSDGSVTMIAEIPNPGCVGTGSPWTNYITTAKSSFDAVHTATGSFQTANDTVTVIGAGFFDFLHGQTGVAPNGFELHAILGICFGLNCTPAGWGGSTGNDFSVSVSPSSQSVAAGSSVSYTVSTAVTSGSAQTVSLSVSGLPAGVTGSFSPSSVTAGGSSTLTLTASSTASAATATFTVKGTATSGSHTATASVSVTTGSSCSTSSQLLGNPGFESGSVTWTTTSGVITTSTASDPSHSGSYLAYLDGYGVATTDTAQQTITIPSGACSATFSFWLSINTAETTTTTAYDTLSVQILNSSGTVLTTLATYSNLNAGGYTQKSFDLSAYKGQTIQVYFKGVEDSSYQTSFLVDDTAVNVTQ